MTRTDRLILLLLFALALALRIWRLDSVPPGWRDDELINAYVISQHVLDGDWAFYFPDASGHEALYHTLVAGAIWLFDFGLAGIRGWSVLFGSMAVPLIYWLGRLFWRDHGRAGQIAALGAAALLAVSFWSLMYSRFGLRHISVPFFTLLTFALFWQGMTQPPPNRYLIAAAFVLGLSFYTYFAARGIPLILLAYLGYLWLVRQETLRGRWRGLAVMFGLAFLLALPLALTLWQQPEAEARVSELALPLTAARAGNFAPLLDHISRTLNMFHSDGDPEWLYNVPERPLFNPLGAAVFWLGVILSLWESGRAAIQRENSKTALSPAPLLLLWWLAGISPGFLSVPAASLGHTILAQPATYLLAAVPLLWLGQRVHHFVVGLLALGLVTAVGWRDLTDYFVTWPERGNVRFLYRADLADVAEYVRGSAMPRDFGVASFLAGPWDKLAFGLALDRAEARPRFINPERVLLLEPNVIFTNYPVTLAPIYPEQYTKLADTAGGYDLAETEPPQLPVMQPVCFENGLCLDGARAAGGQVDLVWRVARPLDLPPQPLISNPPPPGVYAGSRLRVFAQLLAADGSFITGDDGLWVDPSTLAVGDRFLQRHYLIPPAGANAATIAVGLYDPMTGARLLTSDGRDSVTIGSKN